MRNVASAFVFVGWVCPFWSALFVVGIIKVSLTCQRVAEVRHIFAVGGWLWGGYETGTGLKMFATANCFEGLCEYVNSAFLLILIKSEIKPFNSQVQREKI